MYFELSSCVSTIYLDFLDLERQALTVSLMICAVRHGTVLFSTTIAPGLAWSATSRVTASKAVTSVARPPPIPLILVGVLTATRIMSASPIHLEILVEKNKLGVRAGTEISSLCSSHWLSQSERDALLADMLSRESVTAGSFMNEQAFEPSRAILTSSTKPGSYIGRCFEFQRWIRLASRSTTVTVKDGF